MAEIHSELDQRIGAHLRAHRERQGLRLLDVAFAARARLSFAELEDYEGGRDCLSADVLRQLAPAYGLSVVDLYLVAGLLTPEDLGVYRSTP